MSAYDNYEKDELAYEINSFLNDHTISELMSVVTDSIAEKEYLEQIKEEKNENGNG